MWEETTTVRLRDAHRTRDTLIAHSRLPQGSGGPQKAVHDPEEAGMTRFPRYTEEDVRRLNRLQAEYFGKNIEIFEPPLPEGVPERLERIVGSAAIVPVDSVLDIGTGTGILIPLVQEYSPARIYANDLSEAMLAFVKTHFPSVTTVQGDVADLTLADGSLGVAFINACYPNIIDKHKAFTNLRRMLRVGGRLLISHPLGKSFVEILKKNLPFPLDDFPRDEAEATELFAPYGFRVTLFIDENEFYLLRLAADE